MKVAYSLKIVLSQVEKLVDEIDGKIVVTSDYGECFGENNIWGHQNFNHCDTLTEVPWLEVE